jgi:hypothetical protein
VVRGIGRGLLCQWCGFAPCRRGVRGLTGARGRAGSRGAQGAKGDTGAQGLTGTTGAQGAKGDTGAQGLTGSSGAQGAKGDPGVPGAKGDTGAPGSNATINGVAAGGDLTGTYPNPTIAAGAVGPSKFAALPHAIATASNAQTFASGFGTQVTLDQASDTSDLTFSATNSSLTVNRGGLYMIHASLEWSYLSTTGLRILAVDITSLASGIIDVQNAAAGGSDSISNATGIVRLAAGNSLTLTAQQDSGADLASRPVGGAAVWFEVAWLGP